MERARHLADGLRAARLARRRAEAEELRLITQLACGYHLETESDAHDALYEQDEPHRAAAAAARCESLPPDAADEVGVRWAAAQHRLSWGAAMNLMDRLIIEAAPEIAAERERRTLSGRYVRIQFHLLDRRP